MSWQDLNKFRMKTNIKFLLININYWIQKQISKKNLTEKRSLNACFHMILLCSVLYLSRKLPVIHMKELSLTVDVIICAEYFNGLHKV